METTLADILFHSALTAAGAACAVVSMSSTSHIAANARTAGTVSAFTADERAALRDVFAIIRCPSRS